ncbi:MAG TPA: hypothetical protein DDZ44_00170 [Syntrophomonas wolfei]|uniref:Uncharacterized protein n=1 Tax=Syntrophomonas wolfei TaxID=863 RepID=A0A354YSK4_9FIRM|nr:hypothetical protein [Syntrophomonas wolfei]
MTGARQHADNYPGVSVEKKEGWLKHEGANSIGVSPSQFAVILNLL